MNRVLNLILALYVTGCAHRGGTAQDIVLPSGTRGVALRCDATRVDCLALAGRKCPKGYLIVEENRMGAARADAGHGSASATALTDLGMVVECKTQPEPSLTATAPVP